MVATGAAQRPRQQEHALPPEQVQQADGGHEARAPGVHVACAPGVHVACAPGAHVVCMGHAYGGPLGLQLRGGAQQQQVGQRVLEELLVAAAADVDLDGEPQVLQG